MNHIFPLLLAEVASEVTEVTSTPWYEKLLEFIQSKTVLILVATVALTAFMRASVKIYNAGRLSKNELVTKSEFEDYKLKEEQRQKESIKNVNQTLWDRANTKIDAKLSNIADIRQVAVDVKADSAVIKNDLKRVEQYDIKIAAMEERIVQLEKEVRRLKFGENTTENRRKD